MRCVVSALLRAQCVTGGVCPASGVTHELRVPRAAGSANSGLCQQCAPRSACSWSRVLHERSAPLATGPVNTVLPVVYPCSASALAYGHSAVCVAFFVSCSGLREAKACPAGCVLRDLRAPRDTGGRDQLNMRVACSVGCELRGMRASRAACSRKCSQLLRLLSTAFTPKSDWEKRLLALMFFLSNDSTQAATRKWVQSLVHNSVLTQARLVRDFDDAGALLLFRRIGRFKRPHAAPEGVAVR